MTTKIKLNLGDRVFVDKYGTGAVVDLHPDFTGIRFDRPKDYFHSCRGQCEFGYGFYVITPVCKKLNVYKELQTDEEYLRAFE